MLEAKTIWSIMDFLGMFFWLLISLSKLTLCPVGFYNSLFEMIFHLHMFCTSHSVYEKCWSSKFSLHCSLKTCNSVILLLHSFNYMVEYIKPITAEGIVLIVLSYCEYPCIRFHYVQFWDSGVWGLRCFLFGSDVLIFRV